MDFTHSRARDPELTAKPRLSVRQALRIMKLMTVFMLITCLAATASGYSQITLSEKNTPLQKILKKMEQQSGYEFLYPLDAMRKAGSVTVQLKNASFDEAMKQVLAGKPLTYSIREKTVVIKEQPLPIEPREPIKKLEPFLMMVNGRVMNSDGQPLAGVSIQVKGTKKGTLSASDGRFSIEASQGDVLELSSIGYQPREYTIGADASFTVVMVTATNDLDAIQVQAYGVTSKRFTTSNIASVRAEDIAKQPVSNPLLALQGRVAGLMVTPASGIAGDRVTVRIQGVNSIRGGTQPFYVVDGIPFSGTLLQPNVSVNTVWSQQSGNLPLGESGTGGSPLNYINASDIESIEVLKDADATAIYGSRAANGAIIITTKKGKPGPLKLDVNLRSGFTEMPRQLNYMDLEQYLSMRLEAKRNNNEAILPVDYDLNGFWGDKLNNNLQDYFFGKGVSYHDMQASANGGNGITNYRVNLGYIRQNSIYGSDNSDQKVSMGLNLNTASSNRRFQMNLAINGMVDRNRIPVDDITGSLLTLPPNSPAFYNIDGTLNWALDANGLATLYNPLAPLEQRNIARVNNLTTSLQLGYEIAKGLRLSSSFGYGRMDMEAVRLRPLTTFQPIDKSPENRVGDFSFSTSNNYSVEPQLTYNIRFAGLKLEGLIGSTFQQSSQSGRGISAYSAPSDDLMETLGAYATLFAGGDLFGLYRYNAIFSRLTLNHNDEFLLNLTMRRDGSSRFGPENRFENFGAIGLGWIFTRRPRMKNRLSFLSFGKLRASYGTTGSDQIGNYTYMDLYGGRSLQIPYQGLAGLAQSAVYNPNLEWERTNKLNIGLDLGFINDRISLTGNYAINRSGNLLQNVRIPSSAGVISAMWINFPGTVENRNLEFSLNSENINSGAFQWSTALNFTRAKNILVSIGDISRLNTGVNNLMVGESVVGRKLYRFSGVDPLTGNYRFTDKNGNPVTNFNFMEDAIDFADLSARFYGGVSNRFLWKGFSLDIQTNLVRQNAQSYLANVVNPFEGSFIRNEPSTGLTRWHEPGDVGPLKKYGNVDNPNAIIANSDKGYEDATYFRINTVAIGWQLNKNWFKLTGFRGVTLGLQAQNLWTVTNYSGLDPETGLVALPQPRAVVFNLNISF